MLTVFTSHRNEILSSVRVRLDSRQSLKHAIEPHSQYLWNTGCTLYIHTTNAW